MNFETDEALLTGESLPVGKETDTTFDPEIGAGDRLNVAFSSSTVTKGRARGVVFATGMKTEIGTIATALRATGSKTRPVKRKPDGSAKPPSLCPGVGLDRRRLCGYLPGCQCGHSTPEETIETCHASLRHRCLMCNHCPRGQSLLQQQGGHYICRSDRSKYDSCLSHSGFDCHNGRWYQKDGPTTCHRAEAGFSRGIGGSYRYVPAYRTPSPH